MKEKRLNIRLSERRYNILKKLAEDKDKTVTQVVDELIDIAESTQFYTEEVNYALTAFMAQRGLDHKKLIDRIHAIKLFDAPERDTTIISDSKAT